MLHDIAIRKSRTEERERHIAMSFPIYSRKEVRDGPQCVVVTAERVWGNGWRTSIRHECVGDGSLKAFRELFVVTKAHIHQNDLADLFDADFRPINRTSADVFDALMAKAATFIATDQRGEFPVPRDVVVPMAAERSARSDLKGSIFEWDPDNQDGCPERGSSVASSQP